MGMDAKVSVGPHNMDAYKGRKVFYHVVEDDERQETWTISFKAEGGYGPVKCGVRWMDHEGNVFGESGDFHFGEYNEKDDTWFGTTKLELKNVHFFMVYLDSKYGYRDDFVKLYEQKWHQ